MSDRSLAKSSESSVQRDAQTVTLKRIQKAVLTTVSDSTARVYRRNYEQWAQWCEDNNLSPMNFEAGHVESFINSLPVTRKTRQRTLSAMRKLVKVAAIGSGREDIKRHYEMLRLVKASGRDTDDSRKQDRKSLEPRDVIKVVDVFAPSTDSETPLRDARNRALLAIMFYTGARRSEIVNLQWSHVDLANGTVDIYGGKGDKDRTVAIVGNTAIQILAEWQSLLTASTEAGRRYLFPHIRRGDNLQGDHPISGTAAYKIVKEAQEATGIVFKPHDARRTLATEALQNGGTVQDVQAQLGHSDASTTIQNYANPVDARHRRKRFKVRY